MADINLYSSQVIGSTVYPAALPLVVSGEAAASEQIRSALDRFENIMQGGVEEENLEGSYFTDVDSTKVRRGALVKAWTAAGTANLDFPAYLFGQEDLSLGGDPYEKAYQVNDWQAVAGANRTFYLDTQCVVLLTWTVSGLGDGLTTDWAAWGLFLDDELQDSLVRLVKQSVQNLYSSLVVEGYATQRTWSGHAVFVLPAGWHSAGIRTWMGPTAKTFRQWARHINVVAFPTGSTTNLDAFAPVD